MPGSPSPEEEKAQEETLGGHRGLPAVGGAGAEAALGPQAQEGGPGGTASGQTGGQGWTAAGERPAPGEWLASRICDRRPPHRQEEEEEEKTSRRAAPEQSIRKYRK